MTRESHKCIASTWPTGAFSSHPCSATGKVERNGKWYCGRHDPVAIKTLYDKREAKRKEENAARDRNRAYFDREKNINAMKADQFDALMDAVQAATEILPHLPDMNTNNNGSSRVMTTRRAQRLCEEALAKGRLVPEL